jgi:Uncharacterized conserved protein (DUF2075)
VIEKAKNSNSKQICFVTGVPGSGKTLAGLNIATERMRAATDEHAVFLSGNGPLVSVLREALASDEVKRTKESKSKVVGKKDAYRHASAFIQNIHHFRDEYLHSVAAPRERVVVFDEAQRAWNREQTSRFMREKRGQTKFDMSEPQFLMSVMDRRKDWCVVVCLIGDGQEINTGEAGLEEWLVSTLQDEISKKVGKSGQLSDHDYAQMKDLAKKFIPRLKKCFGQQLAITHIDKTPIQDAETLISSSTKLTYRWAAGIIASNYIAALLIRLSYFTKGEKFTDDISSLYANLKNKAKNPKLKRFLTKSYRRFEDADKTRNRCAHINEGEPTRQEIEQSISLARLLQRFI